MNGTVYFKDGHTEEMIYLRIFGGMEFVTESGRYYYNSGKFYVRKLVSVELISNGYFEPVFGNFVIDEIDRVEIPNYTIIG